jgi:hypothetical protein
VWVQTLLLFYTLSRLQDFQIFFHFHNAIPLTHLTSSSKPFHHLESRLCVQRARRSRTLRGKSSFVSFNLPYLRLTSVVHSENMEEQPLNTGLSPTLGSVNSGDLLGQVAKLDLAMRALTTIQINFQQTQESGLPAGLSTLLTSFVDVSTDFVEYRHSKLNL